VSIQGLSHHIDSGHALKVCIVYFTHQKSAFLRIINAIFFTTIRMRAPYSWQFHCIWNGYLEIGEFPVKNELKLTK